MAGASTYHSNSSSFINKFEHQVFLSFRGEDVRRTFIDHLYDALKGSGFKVFRDNDGLEHGEDIQSKLYQAIERSQLSIVTLSSRYADSRWCLDELVKIMNCRFTHGHTALPIFYDVEPTHVRNQSGPYEEDFKAHEVRFRCEIGRVNNWKLALKQVADLKGMASTDVDRYESRFIQNIVRAVRKIVDPRRLYVPPYFVGTDSIMKAVNYMSILKAKRAQMQKMRHRIEKCNHCSGKLPLVHRAEDHLEKGHKAPHVAAYGTSYSKDPVGAMRAQEMNEKVTELLAEQQTDYENLGGIEEPLPISTQLDIIHEVVGQKRRGTHISSVGSGLKRPPLPRVRGKHYEESVELREALRIQKEQNAKFEEWVKEHEERIKQLEEMMLRAGGCGGSNNADSDGASLA